MQQKQYFYEVIQDSAAYQNLTLQLLLAVSFAGPQPEKETDAGPAKSPRYIGKYGTAGIVLRKLYKIF